LPRQVPCTWRSVVGALLAALLCTEATAQEAPGASGCLFHVPSGASIQSAIDLAPVGAVIQLTSGEYTENITIWKSLTIRGSSDGETQLHPSMPGTVVRVAGDNTEVRVEDLMICSAYGYEGHGLAVESAAVVHMTRVVLRDNSWFGVSATDHAKATLTDCTIASNRSAGVMSQDFAQLRLERCVVKNNTSHGLIALHLSELRVRDCEIRANWTGVWAWDATRIWFSNTHLVSNMDYGAIATNAALLVLEEATVANNGHHGLLFEESSRGVLHRSRICSNGADGLFADQDAILEIRDCEFLSNEQAGLRVAWGSCIGGFDPQRYFAGRIEGSGNAVPGPDRPDGNKEMALCPSPPDLWPEGFVRTD